MSQLQQNVLLSFMYIFLVHSGQVGYSIIPDFLDQDLGWEGQEAKRLFLIQWMITGMGSVFRMSCKWEVGVRLG